MIDLVGAIDCGGTKILAALADRRGGLRFLPPEAGGNPQDGPVWQGRLTALLAAMARAGHLVAVTLGMAGHGEVPGHDAATAALAQAALGPVVRIMNDVELALRGAFGDGQGVLILAGTGAMAMAQGPRGIARAGGWGDLIGDEGSAYWIGARALRLAARALDGQGGDVDFARALMARLGAGNPGDPGGPLRHAMATVAPRAAIAQVAAHVDALAQAGQPQARAILTRGAGHLARTARAAARAAGLSAPQPWSTAGSVMRSASLAAALEAEMAMPATPAQMTALGGGLRLAAEAAGWRPEAGWSARIGAATRAWE